MNSKIDLTPFLSFIKVFIICLGFFVFEHKTEVGASVNLCLSLDGETVVQHEVFGKDEPEDMCMDQDYQDMEKAKVVIKKYWKSNPEVSYVLLCKEYKKTLKRRYQIRSPEEFSRHFFPYERS